MHPNAGAKWSKNQSTLVQKSAKIGPKIDQNQYKNRQKSVPGPSRRGLEAFLAQGPKKQPKKYFEGPPWASKLEAKITKSHSRDAKCDHFFDDFLHRFWKRFGTNLAPTWEPIPSQNGAKLGPKSTQLGA